MSNNMWVYYENPDTQLLRDGINNLEPSYNGYKFSQDPYFFNYHKIFATGSKVMSVQLIRT